MQYSYDVFMTENDYIEFNMYHYYMQKGASFMQWFLRLLPACIFLVFLLFDYRAGDESIELIIKGSVYLIISLIWCFVSKKFFERIFKKQIIKMKSLGKLPFSEKAKIELTEDCIKETTATTTATVLYSDVERICVNTKGRAIYTFFSASTAMILPFSTFSTDDERLEVIAFLENKIGKTAEYGKSK